VVDDDGVHDAPPTPNASTRCAATVVTTRTVAAMSATLRVATKKRG
jgi:hypothetical protein